MTATITNKEEAHPKMAIDFTFIGGYGVDSWEDRFKYSGQRSALPDQLDLSSNQTLSVFNSTLFHRAPSLGFRN